MYKAKQLKDKDCQTGKYIQQYILFIRHTVKTNMQ